MTYNPTTFCLRELKIEVTHNCMLNCIHCSSSASVKSGRNMKWNLCKEILHDAAIMGVKQVAFSGGEPLLWKHILKGVEQSSHSGMETFLYTTGNVPNSKELLSSLFNSGLSRIMFSLLDTDEQRHEYITQIKGSFRNTLDSASHCAAIGLKVEFHFVPLPHNFRSLIGVAELAQQHGARRVSVLRFVPQGRGKYIQRGQLNRLENLELRKIIMSLQATGHNIRLGSPYNFLLLNKKATCYSGIDRLTIAPDSRIFPCDAFKHIAPECIGISTEYSNLDHSSLMECWEKSHFLDAIRRYVRTKHAAECMNCQVLDSCNSGCAAQKFYAYGNLNKSRDPLCLFRATNN